MNPLDRVARYTTFLVVPALGDKNTAGFGCHLAMPIVLRASEELVLTRVDLDATARAKQIVVEAGIVYPEERVGMDKVLDAAAMTYVAAVATTLLTLSYYVWRAFSGMRD